MGVWRPLPLDTPKALVELICPRQRISIKSWPARPAAEAVLRDAEAKG